MTFEWGKENTLTLLGQGKIDNEIANHFLEMADGQIAAISNSKDGTPSPTQFLRIFVQVFRFNRKKVSPKQVIFLRESNVAYIIDRLKELRSDRENYYLEKIISDYERILLIDERGDSKRNNITETDEKSIEKVTALGFQLERNIIQTMYENGRISRELSNKLRNNISLLEIEMKQSEMV